VRNSSPDDGPGGGWCRILRSFLMRRAIRAAYCRLSMRALRRGAARAPTLLSRHFSKTSTHIDVRLLVERCSMVMSHVAPSSVTYRPFNAASASVEKSAIDPIVQSAAMARKY
jgi:hypothetical protein